MFETLLEFIRFPCVVHVAGAQDAYGDITYTPRNLLVYRVMETVQTIDEQTGEEIVSHEQVYTTDEKIGVNDLLSFPEEPNRKYRIRRRKRYFDGTGAGGDIWVLQL